MRPEFFFIAAILVVVGFTIMNRVGRVSSVDAKKLVEDGARLVDVRTPAEFAQGHLPGALNLSVSNLAALSKELGNDKSTPVVVYCRSGARSGRAKRYLEQQGFTSVHNLGPMTAW